MPEGLIVDDIHQATQQSQSIQTLLEAEKEAAKVVQQARQCVSRNRPVKCALLITVLAFQIESKS